jgi:UDP-N-acetylglucosamine 1-carboxyvinyltransferase
MDRFLVTGGTRLSGSIPIAGAKNSALKLMAASLLAPGRTVLSNVPRIQDCLTMVEVLQHLGADVAWEDDLAIDASDVLSVEAPYELVSRMRASILVLGPLLARCGRARVAMPGGCNIGSRKIDLHVRGLEKMGARFSSEHGFLEGVAPRGLSGAVISLDFPSVGATENVMMAAVAARGTTVIENAAREPELSDLAEFLQEMGGRIEGVGTPTIEILGTGDFHPVRHSVIPDRIEAGTFAIAACATGGQVVLERARGDHMDLVLAKLTELGAVVLVTEAGVAVGLEDRARAVDFVTLPHPGFPTDLQPQMMALLSVAEGTNVFESRFMFVDELNRMGADIRTEGHHAVIRGVDHLSAAPVRALDIRAGAAMVIAGLCADGVTAVEDMYHVDRGYQDFETKLLRLGAEVRRERQLTPAPW